MSRTSFSLASLGVLGGESGAPPRTPRLAEDADTESVEIRVRGRVQGVGFRPTVWRYASEAGLDGLVLNDGEGVLIRARGGAGAIAGFLDRLREAPPPLARISGIEVRPWAGTLAAGFAIVESARGAARTEVAPDAAICPACVAEVLDPFSRHFRYPFTSCTHCGPRLTIVRAVPYDRARTTMAPFALCADCAAEYGDPGDRRFHAEPIACHACGPKARLVRFDGRAASFDQHSMLDDVDAAMSLIQKGEIVAIKALGGYQLACDATSAAAVERLRALKRRDAKPFALMARDLDVIRRYCDVDADEEAALASPAAPIVLLRTRSNSHDHTRHPGPGEQGDLRRGSGPDHNSPGSPDPGSARRSAPLRRDDVVGFGAAERLAEAVAPGLATLGFMLPSTPLHLLLFRRMGRPVVMTSGNLSDEPQAIGDAEAAAKLGPIAPWALVHDRAIENRVDDSVARRMAGEVRILRRARGYAPASIPLPPGFEQAPDLLAYGPDLKATFCLLKDGRAVLSQHQGDLADAATFDDYLKSQALFRGLFDHAPRALACDLHPEYVSARRARARAAADGLPLIEVQHHHAHLAACLAENGRPLDAPPVLGIVLDGLGYGLDGELWGGEFLLGGYREAKRAGTLKPVALPGGEQAAREPWRNLYAHLTAELGWAHLAMNFAGLDLFRALEARPRATLDAMIARGINAPRASSCGRLFDAAAAALGICFERQAYEGQAASQLESIVCERTLAEEDEALAYPFSIPRLRGSNLPYIEPVAMWAAILGDLHLDTPRPVMAARFHKGLARALAAMAGKLARPDPDEPPRFDAVVLSGGCFQNKALLEQTKMRLEAKGFTVLAHRDVPANDGGIALGQAAVAAARLLPSTGSSGDRGEGD